MTLRLKLFLIALVTLLLPWAGFQFIKQMELLLREGQERAQLSSARALAQAFVATAPILPATGRVVVLPDCLLYTSPSPRDRTRSRMPSSA